MKFLITVNLLVSVQGQAEEVTVIIRIIVFDGEFFFLYFLESGFLIKQMCSVRILGGVENDLPPAFSICGITALYPY